MKKIWMLLFAVIMILTIPITGQAASTKITVSSATAKRGEVVRLSISLFDCEKANTLGISMEYDSSVLKKVVSDCTWENQGTIEDFSVSKDNGVWGIKKAKDLDGKICTLAFRIKADAPIGDTTVTCKVVVKKDSKVIGTYTAKGTVSVICEHSYGEWEKHDAKVHKKICKYCEYEKQASHDWGEGSVTKEPTKKEEGLKVYECSICGENMEESIAVLDGETQNRPEDSKQDDAEIMKPEGNDSNRQNISGLEHSDVSNDTHENIAKPSGSNSVQSNSSSQKNENVVDKGNSQNHNADKNTQSGSNSAATEDLGSNEIETLEPIVDENKQQHENEHMDDAEQVQTEDDRVEQEDNASNYLWIVCLLVVVGILAFVLLKLKTNKK